MDLERPSRSALFGWAAIATWVVAYDAWALMKKRETLTAAFYRGANTRYGWGVMGAWLGVTWHLMSRGRHILPDPYYTRYRQVHPLWRLHDLAVERGFRVPVVSTDLSAPLSMDSQPPLA